MLKDAVSKVEKISSSVQDILYEERHKEHPTHGRWKGVER